MGSLKPLRKIQTENYELMRVQDAVEESLKSISSPLINGRLIKDVALSAFVAPVAHGLGRKPEGFFVVDQQQDVRVWRSALSNPSPTTLLLLEASTTATVSIYVF
jgi:hypothetical protein